MTTIFKTIGELGTTPAPWSVHSPTRGYVDAPDRSTVADCNDWDDEERAFANARLIAAAPELYELVREAYEEILTDLPHYWLTRAEEVIEKAGGAK